MQQHADATTADSAGAHAAPVLNVGTATSTFPSHGRTLCQNRATGEPDSAGLELLSRLIQNRLEATQ